MPNNFTNDTPLAFSADDVVKTIIPGKSVIGSLSITNIGRSPARQVVVHAILRYTENFTVEQILRSGERAFQEAITKDPVPRHPLTLAPQEARTTFSDVAPPIPAVKIPPI